MRYLMATPGRAIRLDVARRRSSALKMVVSTSLITGDVAIHRGQLVDRKRLVLVAVFRHYVQREPSVTFQHALRLCRFLSSSAICESVPPSRSRLCISPVKLVDQRQVARVGQRDLERPVVRLDRNEVVAEHQVHRNRPEQSWSIAVSCRSTYSER